MGVCRRDGERLTHAQVKEIVDKAVDEARAAERPAIEAEMVRLPAPRRGSTPSLSVSAPVAPSAVEGAAVMRRREAQPPLLTQSRPPAK